MIISKLYYYLFHKGGRGTYRNNSFKKISFHAETYARGRTRVGARIHAYARTR